MSYLHVSILAFAKMAKNHKGSILVRSRTIKSLWNRVEKGNKVILTFIACIFFLMASMVTLLGEVNQVVQ